MPSTWTPGFALPWNCTMRRSARQPTTATTAAAAMAAARVTPTVEQRFRRYCEAVELRDLPSVDELARSSADPLAVDAARVVLARAREEIRAGVEPSDLAARVDDELRAV